MQFILGALLGGVIGVAGMALCRAAAEAGGQMGIEKSKIVWTANGFRLGTMDVGLFVLPQPGKKVILN